MRLTRANAAASDSGIPSRSTQIVRVADVDHKDENTNLSTGRYKVVLKALLLPLDEGRSHQTGFLPAPRLSFRPFVVSRK
jgi:hypothetical protein